MSTDAATRKELDGLTCSTPGCDHNTHKDGLILHVRCHMKSPTLLRYWGDGVVEVRCKTCNKWCMSIAISPEHVPAMNEKLECKDPACKEPPENHCLRIKPACHPSAGTFAMYLNGHLSIACARCRQVVQLLHVKEATAQA